jgi:hypothetical protein
LHNELRVLLGKSPRQYKENNLWAILKK